jgi:hypothetical protein
MPKSGRKHLSRDAQGLDYKTTRPLAGVGIDGDALARTLAADIMAKAVDSKSTGRRPQGENVHLGVRIFAAVTVVPNQTATEVARMLEVSRERVVSMLATMEGLGLLLAEDDHKRLTVYRNSSAPIVLGNDR